MMEKKERIKLNFKHHDPQSTLHVLNLKKLVFQFESEDVVSCIKVKEKNDDETNSISALWQQVTRASVTKHMYGNYTIIVGSFVENDSSTVIRWSFIIEIFEKSFTITVIGDDGDSTSPIKPRGPASSTGTVET